MCSHLGGTYMWLQGRNCGGCLQTGSHRRCFNTDPMWEAQGGLILETWWGGGVEWNRARGAVRSLVRLVLLGLNTVAMSMGWGSEALLAFPCAGGGAERSKRSSTGSLELMHPRKKSASGSRVVASTEAAQCGEVCVAAPRSRVELGCGRGGGAIERLQRSANGSCVAALASVAGMTLPVTFRVGLAGTYKLMALCGNCGWTQSLRTLCHWTPVRRPMAAQGTRSSHLLVTVGDDVVLRAGHPCSESDSTMWCREAAALSAVLPSEN